MKKIVVTGCTGIIGSAIIREALNNNYEIICIVRKNSKRIGNIPKSKRLTIVECNIGDYATLKIDTKCDSFIHLAWDETFGDQRDNVEIQEANIQYTLNAVQLAKRCGCKVFIGAGSQAEYGVKKEPLTGDMSVNPQSGYGIAKYAAGKLSRMLCMQLGVRFNWIRIVSTYGINDAPFTLISYVISELKAGKSPELTKCEQIWDYTYCDDAARAFLAVAEKGVDGKFYALGSGNARKLADYIRDIQLIINPDISIGYGKRDYYPHQPMFLAVDNSDLVNDTGWKPRIGFTDGIKGIIG